MKADEIAIADVLKHPRFGIVSFQPDLHNDTSFEDGMIRVRGYEEEPFFINVEECVEPTYEEYVHYWANIEW